jgi:type IV pilus assembly protein PilQ
MGLLACATTPRQDGALAPTASLEGIQLSAEEGATLVTLLGAGELEAQSFQETDPDRLVIDLAGVAPGVAAGTTAVYDDNIQEVNVTSFVSPSGAETTRVEIGLGTAVSHELATDEMGLTIRVASSSPVEMGLEEEAAEVASNDEEPWANVPAAMDEGAAPEDMDVMDAPVATQLLDVSAVETDPGTVVAITTDGVIQGADYFALEDPARLVVDLPGMTSLLEAQWLDLDLEAVARVRVGQHEDKVRVVLDGAGEADFADAVVETSAAGMTIALGGANVPLAAMAMTEVESEPAETPDLTEAEDAEVAPAAPDWWAPTDTPTTPAEVEETPELPVADAAAERPEAEADVTEEAVEVAAVEMEDADSEMVETTTEVVEETIAVVAETQAVYGVQLDVDENRERVVIVTEGEADFTTLLPDSETVVVQLHDSAIAPDAEARVVPTNPGVISMVSAFEQPESDTGEVRVVIQRAPGVDPVVEQKGPMLVLDFAKGAKADPLPLAAENSTASDKAVAQALADSTAVPAAIDPSSDALEILAEGGLVNGKSYTGRRISLDFKDVEIDDVLRLIAEVSDLNIIAGDEVNGAVTIRLVDVPWDQALDVILLTRGLGFVRVGNVLRIAPSEILKAEEEARLQERRAKEKLEDLVVKLQPVNYAQVDDVKKMVSRLLSPRGTVDVDARTNTVILKDIASVIDEATALIKAIDTQTPQVMIEAKIVEANLDFLRELGTSWAVGAVSSTDAWDPSSPDRTSTSNPRALGGDNFRLHDVPGLGAAPSGNSVAVANPITQLATGAINLGAFILDERFDVDIQLEAAESYGEGKVISSPRVVTLDNRKASIEQGVSIPFQTFENGDAKLEFIDAVLRLDVTPHITADKSIIMKIEVKRNAPDDSVPTSTGSPAIAKNEANTETLVRDGQTLVIGGIYVVRQADRESRVPYLHKIPVIGLAFKNKGVRDIRQELLVFVTPRIVVVPDQAS